MKRYLSQKALAELLGVSETTLIQWRKQTPPLPVCRINGRKLMFDPDMVDSWIQQHLVSTNTESGGKK
jgi:phage terminase Nu1 subunit (DNA packaging protein)